MRYADYYGRRVLIDRWAAAATHDTTLQVLPTIEVKSKTIFCLRCGQETPQKMAALPNSEFYCPRCINLGRVATINKFYHVPEPNQFSIHQPILTWQGQLSVFQERAANSIKAGMIDYAQQLLWAVTGAGKTEMMFKGLAATLARGDRVAVASPRVDVCLELYPRLQAAFKNTSMVLLHGRSSEKYHYAQLTVCTTHQLLRFYRAFDNLIIDEVDAFPYAADPGLFYATRQALKQTGGCLYLTATPGKQLLKLASQGELRVTYLPLRYHGHLLPVIKLRLAPRWRQQLSRQRLPASLLRQLKKSLTGHHQFLLFVPHVRDLQPVATVLERRFPQAKFTTVHANDPERLAKVQQMRQGTYHFLVTTTILERGVTFPEIDVYVLGADDQVFSTAALVQIAGRAGRSASRPTGEVIFWLTMMSHRVKEARHQIDLMNRKGQCLQR